ncbi:MAG TPA: PAS domain S-box protein [Candidatus Saccharimonadales bacterium]|nr:PAS domain S-box protein [Candidatus Saccharimonadales bacterium]
MQTSVTWEQEEAVGGSVLAGGRAWAFAAVCVGLALLLRLVLDPLWMDRLPYVSFFFAVVAVTHFTEMGPSVFAVVAGFLLSDWFFAAPRHSLLISNPVDRFNAVFYFVICFVVLFYTRRSRRSLARERTARMALGRLAAIIESSDDAIIGRSLDGKIVNWNAGASKLYGYTEAEAVGQPINFLVAPERGKELAPLLERVGRGEHIRHIETTRRRKDGELVEVSLSVSPVRNSAGQIVGVSTIARDIAERKRAEREREHLVDELQRLLGEVKTLSGLLPICAYCKKIRDDKGSWNEIELYIGQRSSANFTHSVCPDCASHHYADFLGDKPRGQ